MTAQEITNILRRANKTEKNINLAKHKSEASAETASKKEHEATASAETASTKEHEATASAETASTKEHEAIASAEKAAEAHNMSTTVGLAGAFNIKATSAMRSMYVWSGILAVSLGFVGWVGFSRYEHTFKLIEDILANNEALLFSAIGAQILFFLIGAAAPIWISLLSTKMISRYFQLSEDYSYKASLAKAYIGFKKQADGLDPIFQERLFAAAITQLDANPLRFFKDSSQPGSPIQDLLQQPFMISALKNNLGFKDSISSWMNERFKTNFYVKKVDLLQVAANDTQGLEEEGSGTG